MPRDFTAASSGRCWRRHDLGIIRRTELDVQTGLPVLPCEDPSNIGQSGSGHLGHCADTRYSALCSLAALCRASGASKGRHCCSKAVSSAFSRHNPELGIRPVKGQAILPAGRLSASLFEALTVVNGAKSRLERRPQRTPGTDCLPHNKCRRPALGKTSGIVL